MSLAVDNYFFQFKLVYSMSARKHGTLKKKSKNGIFVILGNTGKGGGLGED